MTHDRRRRDVNFVTRLQGSAEAKERLQAILDNLADRQTTAEACQALKVGERRFYALRNHFLQAGLAGLEPKAAGRPSFSADKNPEVLELEAALRELRLDLHAAQVREEIALAMPHLFRTSRASKKARVCRRRAPKAV